MKEKETLPFKQKIYIRSLINIGQAGFINPSKGWNRSVQAYSCIIFSMGMVEHIKITLLGIKYPAYQIQSLSEDSQITEKELNALYL